jgi:hypothetical protein
MTPNSIEPTILNYLRSQAATVSLAAIGLSALLIIALHYIKPELAPSWRMLSEYANGSNGWIMKIAFWLMALSNFALAIALYNRAGTFAAKIGIGLHVIVALALIGAGLFDMDPITIKPELATRNGQLHGLTAMVGVPGQVLAALTLAWGLTRSGQVFESSGLVLVGVALTTLVCLSAMFGYLALALPANGGFGPTVMAGWLNRLVVASSVVWLATAAWMARAVASAP